MAIEGLDRVSRKLALIPQRAMEALAEQLEANATALVAEMKRLAPKETGRLAASIGWTWGDAPKGTMTLGTVKGGRRSGQGFGVMRITIFAGGPTTKALMRKQLIKINPLDHIKPGALEFRRQAAVEANYAFFQEFGTSKMAANPFFFPTYRAKKSAMKSAATRAFKKAVKDA